MQTCIVCSTETDQICRCGAAYCSIECQTFDWQQEQHFVECKNIQISPQYVQGRSSSGKSHGHPPSAAKAREMLHNPPHGRPLTDKQRRYFGYLANH